jgi:hypothetical protein
VFVEIGANGFQYRPRLLNGSSGVSVHNIRHVAGVAGLHSPLGQLSQIGKPALDAPTVGQQVAQAIQIMRLGELNLQKHKDSLEGFLGGPLGQPTHMAGIRVRSF